MGVASLVMRLWSWLYQEWMDEMNWFFACWCKFRKAKIYFTDFWLSLVQNWCSHFVHETLKSAEWVYELSWFFACWLWCNNWSAKHRTVYLCLISSLLIGGRGLSHFPECLYQKDLGQIWVRISTLGGGDFFFQVGPPSPYLQVFFCEGQNFFRVL